MAKTSMLEISGHQCLFKPIPAIQAVKLIHRFARALAATGGLTPLAANATKDGGGVDAALFAEKLAEAIDEKLLADVITVCEERTLIDGVEGGGHYDQNFTGDLAGLFRAVGEVLKVSDFFGMFAALASKSKTEKAASNP